MIRMLFRKGLYSSISYDKEVISLDIVEFALPFGWQAISRKVLKTAKSTKLDTSCLIVQKISFWNMLSTVLTVFCNCLF